MYEFKGGKRRTKVPSPRKYVIFIQYLRERKLTFLRLLLFEAAGSQQEQEWNSVSNQGLGLS